MYGIIGILENIGMHASALCAINISGLIKTLIFVSLESRCHLSFVKYCTSYSRVQCLFLNSFSYFLQIFSLNGINCAHFLQICETIETGFSDLS